MLADATPRQLTMVGHHRRPAQDVAVRIDNIGIVGPAGMPCADETIAALSNASVQADLAQLEFCSSFDRRYPSLLKRAQSNVGRAESCGDGNLFCGRSAAVDCFEQFGST